MQNLSYLSQSLFVRIYYLLIKCWSNWPEKYMLSLLVSAVQLVEEVGIHYSLPSGL